MIDATYLKAQWLLGDPGYDVDWFREALQAKGHHTLHPQSEIPDRADQIRQASLQEPEPHRAEGRRSQIMFGKPKDWRRVAPRYDRCPTVFISSVALADTVLFWLWVLTLGTVYKANGAADCMNQSD